jgi:hypothetical protein
MSVTLLGGRTITNADVRAIAAEVSRLFREIATEMAAQKSGTDAEAALSAKEFGRLIGRSQQWVLRQVRTGQIARTDALGHPRIPVSELQRFHRG